MSRAVVGVVLTVLVVSSQAFSGANVFANPQFLNYLKTIVMNDLNLSMRNRPVPNVSGDKSGVTFHLNGIRFLAFNAPVDQATIAVAPNAGVVLTMPNVYYEVGMAYSFTKDSWPHFGASGVGGLLVNQTTIKLEINFDFANGKLGSRVVSASTTIGFGELIDFPSQVSLTKEEVQDEMDKVMTQEIDTQFNAKLQSLPYLLHADAVYDLDIHPVAQPDYTAAGLTYPMLGTFLDMQKPNARPPFAPSVNLPTAPINGDNLQVFVGEYVVNSLFWQDFDAGKFNKIILPNQVPASSPFQLNTGSFVGVIDQLNATWPNTNMSMAIDALQTPIITIGAPSRVTAQLLLTFNVLTHPTAVTAFSVSAQFVSSLTLSLAGRAIAGNMTFANITTMNVVVNNIGKWDVQKLLAVADYIVAAALPDINKLLAKGKQLPNAPADWSYATPKIVTNNGYLTLTAQVTYKAPPQPYVRCEDKTQCPYANTCCPSKTPHRFGCCPRPAATCCGLGSDGNMHCCQFGQACVNGNMQCANIGAVGANSTKLEASTLAIVLDEE